MSKKIVHTITGDELCLYPKGCTSLAFEEPSFSDFYCDKHAPKNLGTKVLFLIDRTRRNITLVRPHE